MKALTVKPLWIKFDDYHKYFQHLKATVYAFAFCEDQPKNNVWPHQVQSVFYMGESATTEPVFDRKNKSKPDKGKLEYAPFKRFKQHMSNMLQANKLQSTWTKLFLKHFGYGRELIKGTLTGKPLYVCVLICPDDVKYPKSWVKRVEQELIDEYLNAFDCVPLLNTKEKNGASDSMKKENSHSQRIYRDLKSQDITRFVSA
jgi:hypothetical protein